MQIDLNALNQLAQLLPLLGMLSNSQQPPAKPTQGSRPPLDPNRVIPRCEDAKPLGKSTKVVPDAGAIYANRTGTDASGRAQGLVRIVSGGRAYESPEMPLAKAITLSQCCRLHAESNKGLEIPGTWSVGTPTGVVASDSFEAEMLKLAPQARAKFGQRSGAQPSSASNAAAISAASIPA